MKQMFLSKSIFKNKKAGLIKARLCLCVKTIAGGEDYLMRSMMNSVRQAYLPDMMSTTFTTSAAFTSPSPFTSPLVEVPDVPPDAAVPIEQSRMASEPSASLTEMLRYSFPLIFINDTSVFDKLLAL